MRRSDVRKSSSVISMSPNLKNRKYSKYPTSGLFPSSKDNFPRTSSSSFLTKTFNNASNSFLNRDFYETQQPNLKSTANNFYKDSGNNK